MRRKTAWNLRSPTKGLIDPYLNSVVERNGRHVRIRTGDLYRVKVAL